MQSTIGSMTCIAALPAYLQFVSDSQDIAPIKEHLGKQIPCESSITGYLNVEGYDAFFVSIADGDYVEIWGICGIVPYNSKLTTRLL